MNLPSPHCNLDAIQPPIALFMTKNHFHMTGSTQIKEFPLTPLRDLEQSLPSVYARLTDGREWTAAAEQEFLELMLP